MAKKRILLHKKVKIINSEGEAVLYLDENKTVPRHKNFLVHQTDDPNVVEVSLRTAPNVIPSPEEVQELLANKENLLEYQKFTQEFGYSCNPHTYCKHQIDHLNLLAMPWLLPEKSLKQLTGLSLLDFWLIAQQLANAGVKPGDDFPIPSKLMLMRLKLRQGWSNPTLASTFNISETSVNIYFWETMIHFCHSDSFLDSMNEWNRPMSSARIDEMYENIAEDHDGIYPLVGCSLFSTLQVFICAVL